MSYWIRLDELTVQSHIENYRVGCGMIAAHLRQMHEWCVSNCVGEYESQDYFDWFFTNKDDAMIFKLVWG